MSDQETTHLSNLSDGAGCTEIWEHLSEQRAAAKTETESESETGSTNDADEDDETPDAPKSTEDTPEKEAASVPCP